MGNAEKRREDRREKQSKSSNIGMPRTWETDRVEVHLQSQKLSPISCVWRGHGLSQSLYPNVCSASTVRTDPTGEGGRQLFSLLGGRRVARGTDVSPHDTRQPTATRGDERDGAAQGSCSSRLWASSELAVGRLVAIPHSPFHFTLVGQAWPQQR